MLQLPSKKGNLGSSKDKVRRNRREGFLAREVPKRSRKGKCAWITCRGEVRGVGLPLGSIENFCR